MSQNETNHTRTIREVTTREFKGDVEQRGARPTPAVRLPVSTGKPATQPPKEKK